MLPDQTVQLRQAVGTARRTCLRPDALQAYSAVKGVLGNVGQWAELVVFSTCDVIIVAGQLKQNV